MLCFLLFRYLSHLASVSSSFYCHSLRGFSNICQGKLSGCRLFMSFTGIVHGVRRTICNLEAELRKGGLYCEFHVERQATESAMGSIQMISLFAAGKRAPNLVVLQNFFQKCKFLCLMEQIISKIYDLVNIGFVTNLVILILVFLHETSFLELMQNLTDSFIHQ